MEWKLIDEVPKETLEETKKRIAKVVADKMMKWKVMKKYKSIRVKKLRAFIRPQRLISAAKESRVWRASDDEIIEIAEQLSPNAGDFMMSLEKGDLIVQEAFVYLDQYDTAK